METETPKRTRIRRAKPILDLTLSPDQVEHAKRMVEHAQNTVPVIEKGIPMPDRLPGRGKPMKYRFDLMEVGDSYYRNGDSKKAAGALRQAAMNFKKRNPESKSEFITAPCEGGAGARIWRRV